MPHGRIAILGLLTVVAYGSWFYGFGVLLDDIALDLGSGVGVLTAGYALAQVLTGVLGLVAGRALDRHGAALPFAAGAALGPAAIIASTFAQNPALFALAFGVGGGVIGATGFYHLTQSVVARLSPGSEARAIAALTVWGAFASPVLIPLTEVSRRLVGWRDTLRLGALAVGVVLVLSSLTVDRSRLAASASPSSSPVAAVREALTRRDVRRLAVSALAGSFGASVLIVLQVPAMVAGGISRSTAASLAGARGVAQLFGRLPLGRVLRRVSARRALRAAKVMVAIGAVLLAFSANLVVAVAFVVVAGTGIGAASPLEGIYAREVLPPHDLGTLMGALHLLLGVAAGLGPLMAGLVVDLTGRTWSGLVLASATVLFGAAVLKERTPASDDLR